MDPVETTVEIDGEYYLEEYTKLKEENEKLKAEMQDLQRVRHRYEIYSVTQNPYGLPDNVLHDAWCKFTDEIREKLDHVRGIRKARLICHVTNEFFNHQSPELHRWLTANGFLK